MSDLVGNHVGFPTRRLKCTVLVVIHYGIVHSVYLYVLCFFAVVTLALVLMAS